MAQGFLYRFESWKLDQLCPRQILSHWVFCRGPKGPRRSHTCQISPDELWGQFSCESTGSYGCQIDENLQFFTKFVPFSDQRGSWNIHRGPWFTNACKYLRYDYNGSLLVIRQYLFQKTHTFFKFKFKIPSLSHIAIRYIHSVHNWLINHDEAISSPQTTTSIALKQCTINGAWNPLGLLT